MTIQAHPKQHTAKTTTLVVERPQNYALLEAMISLTEQRMKNGPSTFFTREGHKSANWFFPGFETSLFRGGR
ncbi:MAG: hypothetical protein AUG82_08665 [Ktedonobacter sp. 13_1_20CM_4_53_11]|nr:MAG: hypothetical protein AUG82_08665 [Ktedonobacter sp. 13_1_20CM_4_53_11]